MNPEPTVPFRFASKPDLPPVVTNAIRALENAIFNEYLNSDKRDEAFGDIRDLENTLKDCVNRTSVTEK